MLIFVEENILVGLHVLLKLNFCAFLFSLVVSGVAFIKTSISHYA